MIHDLVDQMCQAAACGANEQSDQTPAYQLDVLRTQIRQVLAVNGLTEIATDGQFDPELHCAVSRVPCTDEAQVGRIKSVTRAGYRVNETILRYAEVNVWCSEGGDEAGESQDDGEQESPEPSPAADHAAETDTDSES